MFIGHYGVGFGLKRAVPGLSLAILFIAVQFVDILWSILVALGIERFDVVPGLTAASPMQFTYYPYTHSLLGTFVWGLLAFAAFYIIRRNKPDRILASVIVSIAVMSHFFLDLIVHVPDLTIAGSGTPEMGLGAWRNLSLSLFLEVAILAIGLFIYYHETRGRGFWSGAGPLLLGLFLAVSQVATTLGPPPPENRAFTLVGPVIYLAIAGLGYWIDKNRIPRGRGDYGIREHALNPTEAPRLGTRIK